MTTAPHNITVCPTVREVDDIVDSLTTYARSYDRMMKLAYGDHGPDSLKRWREQQAARAALQAQRAQALLRKAVGS